MNILHTIFSLSAVSALVACEQTAPPTSSLVKTTGSGNGGDGAVAAAALDAGTSLADAAPCVLTVPTNPPACTACLTASCCEYANACLSDKACLDLLDCYRACSLDAGAPSDAAGETGSCLAKCNSKQPGASVSAGGNYATCVTTTCAASCTL